MNSDDLNKNMSENDFNNNIPENYPEPAAATEPDLTVQQEESVSENPEPFTVFENSTPVADAASKSQPAQPKGKPKGYKRLKSEIEKLAKEHKAGESYDYRAFFIHAKEIIDLFKKTRDISEIQRKELWDDYRSLCDRVDHLRKEKYPTAEAISAQLREDTLELIKSVNHFIEGAYNKTTLQSARDRFKTMNNKLLVRTKSMYKPDADHCWQAYRKCKDMLDSKIDHLHAAAMEDAKLYLANAIKAFEEEANPFEAMKVVIEERNKTKELVLSKEDTNIIVKQFNELWSKLAAKLDEFKHDRKEKRQARNARRQQKKTNALAQHKKDVERLEKLNQLVAAIEGEITELEEKRDTAYNDEFRQKVEGWINAKQTKLSEFKTVISELQSRINAFESRNTAAAEKEGEVKPGEAE